LGASASKFVEKAVMLPVVWISEAAADLRDAEAWYRDIRLELGERFRQAVEATVDAITERPLQFPVVYRNRRRAGVRRFPYGIFFDVQDHRIVVMACFHGRRNPTHWQSR